MAVTDSTAPQAEASTVAARSTAAVASTEAVVADSTEAAVVTAAADTGNGHLIRSRLVGSIGRSKRLAACAAGRFPFAEPAGFLLECRFSHGPP